MYKYSLNDVEWGEFKVGGKDGIFKVSNSKPYHKANLTVSSNGIPYVTRTSMNNGLEDLIVDENYEKNPKNTISLGAENADFFFQGIDYVSGNKMYSIGNNKITREVGLFLVQVFRQSIKECGFGYGKGLTGTRFKNRYVMLPVDENNNPNWHFMEEYIKERESKQRNDLKEYYKSRLLDLVICPEVLTDVEWGEFFVSDVFDTVQRGKRLTKANQIDGEIPYISSTALNNGVDNFIGNTEKVRKSDNDLTLANSGSVGACFYHNYEYIASDHVTSLKLPNGIDTVYKFISVILGRLEEKYSFNREINDTRIKREKILLPIDKYGNPNWFYMENFIKNIEQKQIKNVLQYLDEYIYIYIMYNHFDKANWKEFFLSDICNINSGVRLTKANMQDGNIPFIGATDSNNGITNFVSNTNASFDKNVLGVNYNGSVVENFYHPYSCVFSDDVKRVSFKDEQGQNKYCYMFLKQMILQQKEKYRYAYKFNGDRMARQKIMMPVDENNVINYVAIEKFINAKEMNFIVNIIENLGGNNYD